MSVMRASSRDTADLTPLTSQAKSYPPSPFRKRGGELNRQQLRDHVPANRQRDASPSKTEGVPERRVLGRGRSGLALLVACALILVCLPAFALEMSCGSLVIRIDDATGRIVNGRLPRLDRDFPLRGGLRLTEGVDEREIELGGAEIVSEEPLTLDFAPQGENLTVTCAIETHQGWFSWRVTISNVGERQRLLALSLPVEVPGEGAISAYDGYLPTEALTEAFDGPKYRTPIPLCAAWSDAGGAATGINPREHLSYIATRGEPLAEGGARVATRAHIVLDPGQELPVELLLCGMTGQWGRGEALHYWYASAPKLFEPNPNIDPRILDASGQYLAWKRNPHVAEDFEVAEHARRCHVGWDWCINPFKRAGDIAVREDWYDYTPANPELLADEDQVTWAEYRARRKDRFARGERLGVAMLLYTPSQIWLEEQLAREHFEDAIVRDPSVHTRHPKGYVKAHDSVVRVFPYNTSWGEQSKRDLMEVADQLGLYGFAFDTATGPAKYRGPGMAGLPERGWDEDGPFVREGVAIRRLEEFVHALRHDDGTTLGVIPNIRHSADYNSCMGADAALFEGEPWKGLRGREWALRDAIGHKPACWWEHYSLDSFVDYRNMTRDEIAAAYQGLADFMCIESLRMGFWPTAAFARGFESMTGRYLPRIEACIDAGWEPVTAARSDDFTWITRYGQGADTHLAVGNETPDGAGGTVWVANRWVEERGNAPVFTMFDGGELTTRATLRETSGSRRPANGSVTSGLAAVWLEVSGVEVPRRSADVAVACAEFETGVPGWQATASWTGNRVDRRLTIELGGHPHPRRGRVRVPRDMAVESLTINGETAPVAVRRGLLRVDLPAGDSTIEVSMTSKIIQAAQERLLDVDFLFEERPAGYIVLPAEPSADEEIAAERIVHYFQWFLHTERDVEEPPAFPVVRGEIPRDDSLMVVINREEADAPIVALPDIRHVTIAAPDANGLERAVDALLDVLDVKYHAPPTFVWRRATNEVGLIDEWLPDPID